MARISIKKREKILKLGFKNISFSVVFQEENLAKLLQRFLLISHQQFQ